MSRLIRRVHVAAVGLLVSLALVAGTAAAENTWPREISTSLGILTVYQPQPETFENNVIAARAAASLVPKGKTTPVFAGKSYVGSLSAAAAPVEMTMSLFALRDGTLPPTLNYETPDPECPINVLREPHTVRKPHVLKLSMTELGQVGAAVVRRWDG